MITSHFKAQIRNADNIAQWLGLCQIVDRDKIIYLKENITFDPSFIRTIIERITVFEDRIAVHMNIKALRETIIKNLDVTLPEGHQTSETLNIPFRPQRSRHGELILSDNPDDPLGLPPHEIKQLVSGIVWRDELFSGKTFREIGKTYGVAHSYVQRSVYKSFEILEKLL